VSPAHSRRLLPVLTFLAAQAALWLVLALAFAALLVLTSPLPWSDAFGISAFNWLPWMVLAPGVFWLSLRFPLVQGSLWRSVLVHGLAGAACVALTVGLSIGTGAGGPAGGASPGFGFRSLPPGGFPPRGVGPTGDSNGRSGPPPGGAGDARRLMPPDFARGGFPPGGPDGLGRGGLPRDGFGPGGFRNRGLEEPFWPSLGPSLLRANFSLAVYLIAAAAAHALLFYRRAQERDREALELTAGLNRAKLDALRLQLQPHFLFNTLNAIATLVHRDANAADELIGDLSDLLRLSLLTTDNEVPLARELELLDRYLAIEQTRLGDRLRIAREIEPATTAALVPTFVLQPLAENAVRHGLEPRSAAGTITISARREGNLLRLTVADDGVGLAADQLRARRGIGLANTEARLQALHGAAARLELHSPPAGGLRVEITLPFQTVPQPAA